MEIHVNTPTLSDRKGWEETYKAYAHFYQMPMEQNTLNTVWSWIQNENKGFYGIIAKDEHNHIKGLMHFRAMPSPLRGSEVGFLDDLFIVPESRGQYIVEALYKKLNQIAEEKSWPFVRWITADNNYRARNVYDKIAEKTTWVTYQMPI